MWLQWLGMISHEWGLFSSLYRSGWAAMTAGINGVCMVDMIDVIGMTNMVDRINRIDRTERPN